jgi:hypothetical protein
MEMQAALEQAVLNAIRTGLNYTQADSGRTLDERPPPRCGAVYCCVWSRGERLGGEINSMTEAVGVNVTVVRRLTNPFDRWLDHRDEVELRLNRIRAIIGKDVRDHSVINAAAALADLEASNANAPTKRIGYRMGLVFERYEAAQTVTPAFFNATGEAECGIMQTAVFGRATRIQALGTMG